MIVNVRRTATADPNIPLPHYQTDGAAGADLRANLPVDQRGEGVTLAPLSRALIPTGLQIALPQGYEMQVRPRSGLALKQGLTLLNTPGTIDADYRGEIGIIVINLGAEPVQISHGDRIAQAVIAPAPQAKFIETETLPDTTRSTGGFGSTGAA